MKTGVMFLLGALAVGAMFVGDGWSQDEPDRARRPAGPHPVLQDAVNALPPDSVTSSDAEALRKQYIEIATQKAQLLDEDALRKAIEESDQSLKEIRARQQLNNIREQLKQLATEYGDTEAGRVGAALLEFAPTVRRRDWDRDRFPRDDMDRFDPRDKRPEFDRRDRARDFHSRDLRDEFPADDSGTFEEPLRNFDAPTRNQVEPIPDELPGPSPDGEPGRFVLPDSDTF